MEYVNSRVAEALRRSASASLLDIGCGVGGSLLYLASRTGISATGITISPVQHRIGVERLEHAGCADRCRMVAADYLDPQTPALLGGPFDTAMAVESFIHMSDTAAFFRRTAGLLSPGGELLLCDDFLSPDAPRDEGERRLLDRFRDGWHAVGLRSLEHATREAARHGLHVAGQEDLTSYLELRRPRDRLIGAVMALTAHLPLRSPFWQNMRGGDALQRLLGTGAVTYRLIRFARD
jgi:cyclopropane fatty-acyl-phospholipid synthase-like methyltransferase